MIVSNVLVMSHPGCAQQLRQTYKGLLGLPMTKPGQPPDAWLDWPNLALSLIAGDLLSSVKLLLAWAEDLPQGITGFVLTRRAAQGAHRLGFAALSAMVSLVKGCLIPTGQGCLAARLAYVLRNKLDVWKPPDFTTAELLGLPRQDIQDSLQLSLSPSLRKHAESVIADMGLRRDLDLHEPVFAAIEKWSEQKVADELKKVSAESVAVLKRQGAGLQEVFANGYSLEAARGGGFALSVCLEAGIGLQECLQAGFRLPEDLRQHSNKKALDADEMDELRECEAADYVADLKREGASIQELFAKGYSLIAARAGGFTLSACLEAGIGLQDCLRAGFRLPKQLRKYYSEKVALDAGEMVHKLRRCEVLEASESVAALKRQGAGLQEVFANGYSLEAARGGGFALSACLGAGIGLQDCLRAGFRLPEELRMSSNRSTLDAHEMEMLRRAEAAGR